MDFLDADVSGYMRRLADRYDDHVLLEMEALAEEKGFPIVGRMVGALLEILARSINAKRIFEMGSGYGYSAFWFARAAGANGDLVLTDGDPANAEQAEGFLKRAGLWNQCNFVVGDAIQTLRTTAGEFDIVYCDIDKGDYPEAFEVARKKVRKGGYYICDNVLWSGRVARSDDDALTQAIRAHNESIYSDWDFSPAIIPIRDGVMVALRVS